MEGQYKFVYCVASAVAVPPRMAVAATEYMS